MTEKYELKEKTIKNIKEIQKLLLEKSQSTEWADSARYGWLKDIETLQSAIIVIEKF